jgi:phage host-nuclease inhibitor protein Gam
MTIEQIEQLTRAYADRRAVLAERVRQLHELLDRLKRRRIAGIKAALSETAEAENVLRFAIRDSNGTFEKPRTHVFHGVKVGFRKGPGGLTWEDSGQVCKLIKRHLADAADTLIKTTETPIKSALKALPAASLAKVGVEIVDAADQVVVEPVDDEVDKLVAALLDEATEDA